MTELPRSVLPIPEREHIGVTTFDAKDPGTSFPPIEELRPPAGAPNVLVVLLDDVGFGASSAFGGPVNMPTADRLSNSGLRYNRFHTTALCAPTRQALLTGRNHHSVRMGSITELATSAPGQSSVRPKSCAPLAETLKLNGYSTAQFGKCHEVPTWQTSPMGPFDAWPTQSGFEYFYGFVCAETNQYYPTLTEGTAAIDPPKTPEEGYHFTEDIADRSIDWIKQQKALMPDKPFYVYWAPGATHAPHHVPNEWSDRYSGRFSAGWDALREEILTRQKEMGVVPQDAELTERHDGIPAWDDVDDDLKPVLARQMEIYAGFLEHTDYQLGRIVDSLDELGVLDDTIIYYIIGDNGASAEGSIQGCFNEYTYINGRADVETTEYMAERIDKFGTPEAYNHFAVGWAHAMNTPFQWTKQVASHWGGTRNATVVHWPKGIEAAGEIRDQFSHVIDVAPTILDAAGIPQPDFVNGIQQKPIEGASMTQTFDDPEAPDVRSIQYFEMFGNRGIYYNGWTAVTKHKTPWMAGTEKLPEFNDDVWELYAPGDWSQANDLSAEQPDRLHEMQRLWLIEAVKYDVLPLDDRL
ncbi:MAG: arylsulfatase, partial [Acidimicrobiales bacterium]